MNHALPNVVRVQEINSPVVFCACNENYCYNIWTVNETEPADGGNDDDEQGDEDAEED